MNAPAAMGGAPAVMGGAPERNRNIKKKIGEITFVEVFCKMLSASNTLVS